MFAPNYHSAMKFVGPTRKKIGKRTIFNMIGPLSSPALVDRQVVGVFDKKLLKIFANALNNLNIKNSYQEYSVGHGVAPQNFYDFKNWLINL